MSKIPLSKAPINPYLGWDEPEPDTDLIPDVTTLVHSATFENKRDALLHVLGLEATGSTNINDALLQALSLVENVRKSEHLSENIRPTIVFLTDGEPTVGVTSSPEIKKNVKNKNKELNVPIFGLGNVRKSYNILPYR